jgi:hypothetical protein
MDSMELWILSFSYHSGFNFNEKQGKRTKDKSQPLMISASFSLKGMNSYVSMQIHRRYENTADMVVGSLQNMRLTTREKFI